MMSSSLSEEASSIISTRSNADGVDALPNTDRMQLATEMLFALGRRKSNSMFVRLRLVSQPRECVAERIRGSGECSNVILLSTSPAERGRYDLGSTFGGVDT